MCRFFCAVKITWTIKPADGVAGIGRREVSSYSEEGRSGYDWRTATFNYCDRVPRICGYWRYEQGERIYANYYYDDNADFFTLISRNRTYIFSSLTLHNKIVAYHKLFDLSLQYCIKVNFTVFLTHMLKLTRKE